MLHSKHSTHQGLWWYQGSIDSKHITGQGFQIVLSSYYWHKNESWREKDVLTTLCISMLLLYSCIITHDRKVQITPRISLLYSDSMLHSNKIPTFIYPIKVLPFCPWAGHGFSRRKLCYSCTSFPTDPSEFCSRDREICESIFACHVMSETSWQVWLSHLRYWLQLVHNTWDRGVAF